MVALDSNVLIDFQEHGNVLLNGGVPAGLDEQYARDLAGLADLVNLWLLRDRLVGAAVEECIDCNIF